MTVRDFQHEDLGIMVHVWRQTQDDATLPELCNPLYCCKKTIVDNDDRVIGFMFARITTEIILTFDKSVSSIKRIKGIHKAGEIIQDELKKLGLDETHVFIYNDDDKYVRILNKLFGFVESKCRTMYLKFGGSNAKG